MNVSKQFLRYASKCFSERINHFVVTTPIYYVNSAPHIGHAYTSLLADIITRWQKVKDLEAVNVFTATGTDEHGNKILQAAARTHHSDVRMFCDEQSELFLSLLNDLNINYGAFVRTTSESHRQKVEMFWNILMKRGAIEKGTYTGWYSVNDEEFLAERETELIRRNDGALIRTSKSSGHDVTEIEEVNYMFDLHPFKDQILDHLNKGWVRPTHFSEIVRAWISDESIMERKLSVSRPSSRCDWGIQVPDDPSQTIYVWLDALVSYLTATDNRFVNGFWPADLQIVGKDILKFHAVYWPSFLLAAEYTLPKRILCHSHWLSEGQKMSKSKGNVVDPFKYLGSNNSDCLRLYLVAQSHLSRDGNFSHQNFIELIDYFANSFGNAAGRVMNKRCLEVIDYMYPYPSDINFEKALSVSGKLVEELECVIEKTYRNYEEYVFNPAWEDISKVLHLLNKFLQDSKFWKSYDDINFVSSVVYLTFECLRCCSILLSPITPLTSFELLDRLSVRPNEMVYPNCKMYISKNEDPPWSGRTLRPDIVPLVRKFSFE